MYFTPGCRHKRGNSRLRLLFLFFLNEHWILLIVKRHVISDIRRKASQEEMPVMRTQYPDSDCLFLRGWANLHNDPPLAALHWTGGDPEIPEEFKSDTFWKHITACYLRHCFDTSKLHKVQQSKLTLQWQQLVSFIQIQCNWLHPGGTPGSNILIKLICEILTMWVFRWLVIWCERSLCFHWKDTGGAGTCFSKTLRKIIAVELSWVRAITNDSVCLSPHGTQFLHHGVFSLCFWWWPVKVFFPRVFFFPKRFATDDSQLSSTWLW